MPPNPPSVSPIAKTSAIAKIHFTCNGRLIEIEAPPMKRLLDVLREDLKLTGTKEGCGEGECGACSVLINGELINSCLVPILQVQGAHVTTVEALEKSSAGRAVQDAFVSCGGVQCGMCTPGMVVASTELVMRQQGRTASSEEIQNALSGNLCRCTGYTKIHDAVSQALQVVKS